MNNGQTFFEVYRPALSARQAVKVIEIGSQDVNGSLRAVCPPEFGYIGVDYQPGNGVDVVLTDPYALPFDDNSADIVVSSSCLEHSEMFWLVFLEVMRILKPDGLFYMNAPSTGNFHRYPVDCWRFYPDSGTALVNWARRCGYAPVLLESYIQQGGLWQDCVCVFLKDAGRSSQFPNRILDIKADCENAQRLGSEGFSRMVETSQNERRLQAIQQVATSELPPAP